MTVTPPTPDLIAEMLADSAAIYGWAVSWDGNVVSIGVSAADDAPDFRAVVVPADAGPFVVASKEFLAAVRALYRSHVAAGSLSFDEAAALKYELQDALDALSPEERAVLAGDAAEDVHTEQPAEEPIDEPLIDPDCRDGKCGSCIGGPCEHDCHRQAEQDGDADV